MYEEEAKESNEPIEENINVLRFKDAKAIWEKA